MGVPNPYKSGKKSRGGLISSTVLVSGVVILALTGRGYHRRRQARSIRGAQTVKINQGLLRASKPITGQQQQPKKKEKKEPVKSTSWKAVDDVSDHFGAAAEGAAGWMKGQAESLLGKDLADTVGGFVDSGLDQVGELTEKFQDWIGDDEDDDDDEEFGERDPDEKDGVHPAIEEDEDSNDESNVEKKEEEKETTTTTQADKPKENPAESVKAESSPADPAKPLEEKQMEQQPPPQMATAAAGQQPPQTAAGGAVPVVVESKADQVVAVQRR